MPVPLKSQDVHHFLNRNDEPDADDGSVSDEETGASIAEGTMRIQVLSAKEMEFVLLDEQEKVMVLDVSQLDTALSIDSLCVGDGSGVDL